jgi:hypothetical protein
MLGFAIKDIYCANCEAASPYYGKTSNNRFVILALRIGQNQAATS